MAKTVERGYGAKHKALRRRWQREIDAGGVSCARCGLPIAPGMAWDLGHHDRDRSVYTGPEHRRCNRATAGRRRARPPRAIPPSRQVPLERIPPSERVAAGRWSRQWYGDAA